jgi:hypothetical protein
MRARDMSEGAQRASAPLRFIRGSSARVTEVAQGRDRLGRECLVQLDHVELVEADTGDADEFARGLAIGPRPLCGGRCPLRPCR